MFIFRVGIRSTVVMMVVASLLLPSFGLASTESDTSLNAGIRAYNKGDYYLALEYFSDAIEQGSSKPALYYNIGVAHYRLGAYEAADEAFQKAAAAPGWEAIALYNRALVAYRQDQFDLAREFAAQSLKLSDSRGLTSLNQRLLARMNNVNESRPAWAKLFRFGLGYNDNVILSEADAISISGKEDFYVDFSADTQRAFTVGNSHKLKMKLGANLRNYSSVDEFDQAGFYAGIEKSLEQRSGKIGTHLEQAYLDGASYQLISSFYYHGDLPVGSRPMDFQYRFSHHHAVDGAYPYLGGFQHTIDLADKRRLKSGSLKIYLHLGYNDREDQTTATEFYSYSPVRSGLGAIYDRKINRNSSITGSVFYQASWFRDPDIRPGVSRVRQDDYLGFRLYYTRRLNADLDLRLGYLNSANRSNFSEFSYNQNIVSIEMLRFF